MHASLRVSTFEGHASGKGPRWLAHAMFEQTGRFLLSKWHGEGGQCHADRVSDIGSASTSGCTIGLRRGAGMDGEGKAEERRATYATTKPCSAFYIRAKAGQGKSRGRVTAVHCQHARTHILSLPLWNLGDGGLMQGKKEGKGTNANARADPDRGAPTSFTTLGPFAVILFSSRWPPVLGQRMTRHRNSSTTPRTLFTSPSVSVSRCSHPLALHHAAKTHSQPRRRPPVAQGQTAHAPGLKLSRRSSQRRDQRHERQRSQGSRQCVYQQW